MGVFGPLHILDPLICFVLAAVCFAIYRNLLIKSRRVFASGEQAEGWVSGFLETYTDRTLKFPVIRFMTKDNHWITATYDVTTAWSFKKGQKLAVVYNKENPEEFEVKEGSLAWVKYLFLVVGGALVVFGTMLILQSFSIISL
ncbi:hypothetical protein COR50_19160 [Chitinophaga caeni]|uniref:DUF3592 domain-containing protein n=1 Tax=Chitinophaga caeni TaxID=2029983 RepID=A0A291QYU3_9BACT|nr:DUF3592 domain-containing protein [Chitinophaga caeni]ATL49120.1 hypothetical protein COR50_19160 [Chitinophaga caeni]